jgi:NDP-sugar pyrophosphorylase family protein
LLEEILMNCTVILLAGGQGLRMGGLGQLTAKTALVAYDWPLLIRALHQMGEHGFSNIIISTNSTFYSQLTSLVASYSAAAQTRSLPTPANIQVILNPEHEKGPLPALAEALKYVQSGRCLLYLADIFQIGNSLAAFADVADDKFDYLGAASPFEPHELKRGGLVYARGQEVYSIVEKPQPTPAEDALRWNGIALFNRDLLDDLQVFLSDSSANQAIGDIFEYRRSLGRPVRIIPCTDFINVNSPDHLLLAGLYVAMEAHQDKPELCEAFANAAALLRRAM